MREQFEKLPEIATSLSQHIYFGGDNLYHSGLINFQKLVCWINGAWFAYQEQQKIEAALKMFETEAENSWKLWKEKADMYEQGAANAYERSYWILKGNG